LTAPEVAQIAGRAGRHMNDGTFGVTADAPEIDPDVVARVESHEFPPLKHLFWRNTDLRMTSIEGLLGSLRKPPPVPDLIRPPPADDQLVLEAMVRETEVRDRATAPARIRLLWDVAQVPDFRKLKPEIHGRFLTQVFVHLTGNAEKLPEDWVASHVSRIDRIDGDIHVLMDRIAAIRVWTFLAHRGDWMADSVGWQERTREVEDRLSDALHEKLTTQFVDSRTAHLVKRLRGNDLLTAEISDEGAVDVDGHRLGNLDGLRFRAERTGLRTADRAVFNAANAALRPVLARRVAALAAAADEAFTLDDAARVVWDGEAIAALGPGPDLLHPQIELLADERVEAADRRRVDDRLRSWFAAYTARHFAPLMKALSAPVPAVVRGVVFHLAENLGSVARADADRQVATLTDGDRKALARLGVRLGVGQVFMPALLKPAATALRAKLWIARHRDLPMPALIAPGRVTVPIAPGIARGFYLTCGFQPIGDAAYRVDMLERFAAEVRKLAREKTRLLPPALLSLVGANLAVAVPILQALGFRAKLTPEGVSFGFRRKPAKPAAIAAPAASGSPFAKLKERMPS
ncbi:MAG: disulfide oxidoreductase, partial [Rhodospirillaceae bacterium]